MMRAARRIYRLLLLTYPAELRRELGPEMLRTFEDRMERSGSLRLALRELLDVVVNGLRARSIAGRSRPPVRAKTMLELLARDLLHAARSLLRSPGFTGVTVLSLALAIGASTAMFGLVDALLWKPMPVESPEELVAVYQTREGDSFPGNTSYPNYRDLSESGVFRDLVGFQGAYLSLRTPEGEPELVWGEVVTENYFSGLGVPAALGRTLRLEDAHRPVAVLSHDFWRRRFDRDESIVGSTIRVNGRELEIVGVATEGFTGAKFMGFTPDLWLPMTLHDVAWPASGASRASRESSAERFERRSGGWLNLRGRLAPGISLEEARSALATLASRLEAEFPDANEGLRLHALPAPRKVEPVVEVEMGRVFPLAAILLLAIVGILLLVACANVASLMLARTLGRERELALRLSLGATRSRLLRQLLLESLLLALVSGLGGVLLARALLEGVLRLSPVLDFPIDMGLVIDWRVLTFTAAVTLVAALVATLLPAFRIARRDVSGSLKHGEGGPPPARLLARRLLVIPQIALSLVALVSAGLLVQSFRNASAANPGFATEGILLASVNLELEGYDEEGGAAFYRDLMGRLRSLPGVDAASLAFPLPLDAYTEGGRILPDRAERSASDESGTIVFYSTVGDDYFETMETPLVHGRGFDARDDEDSIPVAIVNETLARRFWPGEHPVGKRFTNGDGSSIWQIVGVARDGSYLTLGEAPRPYFYLPLRQNYRSPMTLVLKSRLPVAAVESELRREVQALDATVPLYGAKTIGQFLSRSLAGPRALALVVSFFALLALTIATLGVYGLMSFTVSQRRHELGIRMALGASKRDVIVLFLAQAAKLVVVGLGLGLALAWASTRVLEGLLFGVDAASPSVYAAVVALLAIAAIGGSFVPSRRASRLDPLRSLRHE